jgi:hypothetical protein
MPKNKNAKAVLAKKASNEIKLKDILNAEFNKKVNRKNSQHRHSENVEIGSLALQGISQLREDEWVIETKKPEMGLENNSKPIRIKRKVRVGLSEFTRR